MASEGVVVAVTGEANARLREGGVQNLFPLVEQNDGGNEHHSLALGRQLVRDGRDREAGLTRTGDGIDNALRTIAAPGRESFNLPVV